MTDHYEWDPVKDSANRRKHGIGLAEAAVIFEGPVFTRLDDREDYGETREVSIGLLGGAVVLAVAHTERSGRCRLVSARRATPSERRMFYAYLDATLG